MWQRKTYDHTLYTKVEKLKRINFWNVYEVYITDGDVDNLMAHCKSGDDDLGDKELTPNQYFHWRFRQNIFLTTVFFCTFRWMASDDTELKSITFNVFDVDMPIRCGDSYSINNCYWLVRTYGFYFSMDDKRAFPDGWTLLHVW